MDSDINEVTLLVVVFLVALALLIFGMDWLEDTIDAPPSRLSRWLRRLRRRVEHDGQGEAGRPGPAQDPPAIPQQRSPESAPSPLANTVGETDQAGGNTSAS